ncbi:MAG: hypothetical protein RLZZ08_897 [Pseudomonadota bacterium]|jgi:uncharacterized protein (DUF1697 family)
MTRYVALLGAINVGGNRLSMAELRKALEWEDFEDVETVVASGNVLFSHEERPSAGLAEKLAYVVRDAFDIDTFAVVLNRAELAAVLAENPFRDDGEDKQVHVHFLEGEPAPEAFAKLIADQALRGPERIAAGKAALHVDYVDGVGGSRMSGDFIARRLGCRHTARNIRSIRRILEIMES